MPREPSEEVVERFGKSAQDNPYMLDLRDFFRQMVQRQNELEKRVFDVNTRVSRMEGRFIVITTLAVALTATIVGAIFRFFL
ncbi:MAG: hypothetical protein E3J35_09600 [Methanomassiliicoccales archaeon]|nr:MAG: hypothetical protein E3J35_09600 [Methanomassiliicoccales archaeon]